ncbi:hypothetical protein PG993_013316 [Apiospora rasikravindrae]|uniref:2EXR domain-containing protein n=1 Tax=Apiospora rasikravindrae TaxID=990691 RepID=A0ABR1RZF2_9PEZI
MEFVKFPKFPPEIRDKIWKEAVSEEADGRLVFVHKDTLRVLPTRNSISPLLSVNAEARQVALKHYNVRLPIFRLPPLKYQLPLSFVEWIVTTADVQWGRGTGERDHSLSHRERYCYHYVLHMLEGPAWKLLRDSRDDKNSPSGCMFLNESTDRFILSHDTSFRDKSEYVDYEGCLEVHGEPAPDLFEYHIMFDYKAEIFGPASLDHHERQCRHMSPPLPLEVRCNIPNIVFCENTVDPQEHCYYYPTPEYDDILEDYWYCDPTDDCVLMDWKAEYFPKVKDALKHPNPKVMYLGVPASASRALLDQVETETARCLTIHERDVYRFDGI